MSDRDDVKADLARYGQKDGDVLYLAALREIEALETEAHAMVAAALREAATLADRDKWGPNLGEIRAAAYLREAILALIDTPDDTALDRLIAEAERRGMERAINVANGCDRVSEVGPTIRKAMNGGEK